MNHKLLYRIFLLCFFSALSISVLHAGVQQQSKGTVTGRIVDREKQPYYPVAVAIEGVYIGGYTNEKGIYHINDVPAGNQTIVVSGIGVKTKKVPVRVIAGTVNRIPDIEIDTQAEELDEVQVIGKSEARRQQEQAYAISVLDIKKAYNSAAPLNKLLNNVSSVRIREEGGVGSNYNFSLNGFSGNQVKFFLDGIPMDNFGSSFNLANISANMAERVEVYKGVLPVNLGADALGGAVNIVSRKDANYLDATYSFGSFNTHKVSVNGAYTHLKTGFTVRANAFYNYSDNDYKVFAPIIDLATNTKVDERWVKMKSESVIPSIRYKKDDLFLDGLSLSLYGTYSSVNSFNVDTITRRYNWLGESVPSTSAGEGYYTDSKIKNREWLGNGNISYVIDTHQSLILNHVVSAMRRTMNDKVRPDDENNNVPQQLTKNITGLGWQIRYDRWNANVFGKMYKLYSSTYKRLDEYTENARWEKVRDHKTNFGYGAAATYYILPSLQAKFSYEHAYRLPESIEMFGDGLIQQRNPDLKPESSRNLNLGLSFIRTFGAHQLSADGNFIYRYTTDFILKGVSLTSNPTTGYENLGKVLTKGVEAAVRYNYKDLFHMGANFTYQDITDQQRYEKTKDSFVGEGITENITYKERLPNIPYLFANADAGFRFHDLFWRNSVLTFDYNLNYIHSYYLSFPGLGAKSSKKVIPEQFSHDLALGYSMDNGKYSVVVECTNLTNQKLYDNYRLQKPGRAFNVKLRYFFSK